MIYESSRKMNPDEQMAYEMGRSESKAEIDRMTSENARLTAANSALENDIINATMNLEIAEKRAEAAIKMLKQSNPCNHCTHFADGKYCNYCDGQCSNFKWRDPTEQEEST